MRSHVEIIKAVGPPELGRRLGLEANTIYAWLRAKSIPAAYWREIVRDGITSFDELATAAEGRRRAKRRA